MSFFCCMRGCSNGMTPDPQAKFFPFPSVRNSGGRNMEALTRRRRMAWVCAVNKPSITFEQVSPFNYVCSRHFHSGQPAFETLEDDPDWVPSLHLGHPLRITAEKIAEMLAQRSDPQITATVNIQNPEQTITTSNTADVDSHRFAQQISTTPKITDNGAKKFKEQTATTSRITELNKSKQLKATTSRSAKVSFFAQHECCVMNCDGRSHNDRGQRMRNGLSFHPFPIWRKNDGIFLSDLTKRRREAWVAAVGRDHITFEDVPEDAVVCTRHFISGKPAHDMMEMDDDWVPSLYLGRKHHRENIKTHGIKKSSPVKERPLKRKLQKKVTGKAKTKSVPWRDLKSRLMGLINDAEPTMETPPIMDENKPSFEDFFRNSLKTSLDGCLDSGSQTPAESRPSLDLDWFSPPVKSVSLSRDQTSSPSVASGPEEPCANCVLLQERILQLEERLATPQFIQDPRAYTQWTQPLPPEPSPEKKSPPKAKFDMEKLKRHWFLRYSLKDNLMWCHVCRYYAATAEHGRRSAFVAGTQTFSNFSIVQHSRSGFHIESVKKFKARKGRKL